MTVKTSRTVLFGSAAAVVLAVATTAGMAMTRQSASGCSAPDLPGQVVDVTVTDMGRMMGGYHRRGGPMAIFSSAKSVSAGQISLRVHNDGGLDHEVIVMPLTGDAGIGQRPIQPNDEVDENGSLGEASKTCGAGTGDGIAPGASGWVSLNLSPGRYELLCNIEGHYGWGAFAELDVT